MVNQSYRCDPGEKKTSKYSWLYPAIILYNKPSCWEKIWPKEPLSEIYQFSYGDTVATLRFTLFSCYGTSRTDLFLFQNGSCKGHFNATLQYCFINLFFIYLFISCFFFVFPRTREWVLGYSDYVPGSWKESIEYVLATILFPCLKWCYNS